MSEPWIVPIVHRGLVLVEKGSEDLQVSLNGVEVPGTGPRRSIIPPPQAFKLRTGKSEVTIRPGGWTGRVTAVVGRLVSGQAQDLQDPASDVAVIAFSGTQIMAFATARAADDGRFLLVLPEEVETGPRRVLHLGIVNSDYLLEGGVIAVGQPEARPHGHRRSSTSRTIRIKIACPNLKEAPAWGDYHFARSLQTSLEALGQRAIVDTADAWYSRRDDEDVAIVLRGRARYNVQPGKINILWLISHPDRVTPDEYADYDKVAVASDIYAQTLRMQRVANVVTMHQATDVRLFRSDLSLPRKRSCLFVGNSRREYRTMVRWCIQRDIPLDLYGGGWEGILDPAMVQASTIANVDLPRFYASHQILLNDHWDSMRKNGFLSNRLFDGSATGTPIVTDAIAGIAEVFGDTIPTAASAESFAALIEDGLTRPDIWLERAAEARRIVHEAHSFDHRAAELVAMIEDLS
ncbi:CgeB family protein [Falsirhodobacter deserti]|uniref:CgeB family protein n=1 Tax=Falsirhodobacter deserti TaxID=1365611 RepID=UPI0013E3D4A6|nr:glycosyltransferase [Falsirhodobacter deserti]